MSSEFYERKEDHIILWPKFGSKTDSATYRQAGWRLSDCGPEKLNPVQWIKKLITLSQSRRQSRQDLHSLFITTRGRVNAASRTVIAGWIRTLFKDAKITASPGSFRAAVNSKIWVNNNVSIDEVLQRGNWRSKDTFFRHYFKEVPSHRGATNSSNLSTLFAPV